MNTLCNFCKHYSEEFLPEENHKENYCNKLDICCFIPRSNCPAFTPNIIRIPAIRSPRFDTKRSLIHQLAINHPDATVQQMADLISTLSFPNIRLI